jgi:hypothetical protein
LDEKKYVIVEKFFKIKVKSNGEKIFEDGMCKMDVRVSKKKK